MGEPSVVERVAKAICAADGKENCGCEGYQRSALAAILETLRAIREPTPEMVEAALHARVPGGAEVWCFGLPQEDAWTPHETARNVIQCAITGAIDTLIASLSKGTPSEQR